MKRHYLFMPLLLLLITSKAFTQANKIDTLAIYNKIAGDYEISNSKQTVNIQLTLYVERGALIGVDKHSKPTEFLPIDLENLKFRIKDDEISKIVNFQSDSNNEIVSCELKIGKKKFEGGKLNMNLDTVLIADKIFSIETLRDELTQVKNILTKNHPAPYKFTSKKEFNKIFEEQMGKINRPMGVREFYVIAAPLVEILGCGHTQIELPIEFWNGKNANTFPIELIFIENKAYVLSFYEKTEEIPIGSEIVSINSIKMEEIIAATKNIISSDGENETWKYQSLYDEFGYYFKILYGVSDTFLVEYKTPDTKLLAKKTIKSRKYWELRKHPKITSTGDPNLDLEMDLNKSLSIITISNLEYYDKTAEFKEFLDRAFKTINEHNINNLILDVRGNVGGDPICTAMLFSYLEKEPVPFFKKVYAKQYAYLAKPLPIAEKNAYKGNVYILIDGACASVTGFLCSLLKYHKIGTFIGEETAATYECNDFHIAYRTKETQLELKVAQKTLSVAVKGISREHGIKPDYPIKAKIDDIINGKDTVKKYAYSIIKNNSNKEIE